MDPLLQLRIDGVICQPIIGWYSEERTRPQDIHLDLQLELSRLVDEDDLSATIDYHNISLFIQQQINLTHFKLLESLAQFIAKLILEKFSLVNRVVVCVSKPSISDTFAKQVSCTFSLPRSYPVVLALGSNMHNPVQQLINAVELLHPLMANLKVSPIYKTRPFGFNQQDNFYNACISGEVNLLPANLLAETKKVEKLMGKVEQFNHGPRLIDIDIIYYGQQLYQQYFLTIPHPAIALRDFVLRPLADIEPVWLHPVLGLTAAEMLASLSPDQLTIIEAIGATDKTA